jgi:predicted RNA-binding Zn ribbon-like protein
MDFIGYRSDALGAAVDLVNALAEPGGPPEQMRAVLVADAYRGALDEPGSAEDALRDWARRLRTVFDAADLPAAAAAANALLADVPIAPHLTDHDGHGWHLHYTPSEAGLLDRVRATTAFALAMLVSEYGVDRHGRCAADGCGRVFADTSRNAARRYCSPACANRSAVAAHRARARARQEAARGGAQPSEA